MLEGLMVVAQEGPPGSAISGEAALNEEPRPGADRKLSGKEKALLIATVCSSPQEGRARWTLELLADEIVRLTEHDNISRETVHRCLGHTYPKLQSKES
jgi:hypothetical protein